MERKEITPPQVKETAKLLADQIRSEKEKPLTFILTEMFANATIVGVDFSIYDFCDLARSLMEEMVGRSKLGQPFEK